MSYARCGLAMQETAHSHTNSARTMRTKTIIANTKGKMRTEERCAYESRELRAKMYAIIQNRSVNSTHKT